MPSTIPVIRMLIQQSSTGFVVVERGRAMKNMMQERALMDMNCAKAAPLQRPDGAADYTMNPSINFSQSNAGGIGGVIGLFGGKVGRRGCDAGSLKFKKAETMLTMIDNRSGVQIGVAQVNATKTDFGLGFLGGGGSGLSRPGGYLHSRRQGIGGCVRQRLQQLGARDARLPAARSGRRAGQGRQAQVGD